MKYVVAKLNKEIERHVNRLVAMRVYDDRPVNYGGKR